MTTNIAKFRDLRALSINEAVTKRWLLARMFSLWGRREVLLRNSDGRILAQYQESGFLKRHYGFFMPARDLLMQATQSLTKFLHQGQADLSCQIIADPEEVAKLRSTIDNFKHRSPKTKISARWQSMAKSFAHWRADAAFAFSETLLDQLPHHRRQAEITEPAFADDFDFDFEREFHDELINDEEIRSARHPGSSRRELSGISPTL